MKFQLELPELIRCAPGVRKDLLPLLPEGNLLIVCGRHSRRRIEAELLPQLAGREVRCFSELPAELPLDAVDAALAAGRGIGARAVIGWGGGSVMDAAKAVAALLPEQGGCSDFFYGKRQAAPRSVRLIELPTTAGTGAEVTANAVLFDPGTGIKQSLRTPGMTPDVALVDAELLYDAPAQVICHSGFDALTQAVEGFISRKANALTRRFAAPAAELALENLAAAVSGDHSALNAMAEASLLAGVGFSSSGLGAVHGLGHPLGACCHVPHGLCCAILLSVILRRNLAAAAAPLAELAAATGSGTAAELIARIERLQRQLEIPENFREFGLTRAMFPFIVAHSRSGSMRANPREFSDDELAAILEELL